MNLETATYSELQKEFAEILETSLVLEPELEPTFLQISEFPHYEEVISNWYAFFFRSDESHKFKNFFAETLCEIIKEKSGKTISLTQCNVFRERGVEGKRIDLLLYDQAEGEAEKQSYRNAIVIENKINASVYNDLTLYYRNIIAEENKIGVVMSLQPEAGLPDTYVNILHREFANRLAQNLGKYLLRANDRCLFFLKDFLQQLQSFTITENMKELVKFYYENAVKINELTTIKSKAIDTLLNELALAISGTDFRKGRKYSDALNIRFEPVPNILLIFKTQWLFDEHYYDIELWLSGDLAKKWTNDEAIRHRVSISIKPLDKFVFNTDKTGNQYAFVGFQGVQLEKKFDVIQNLSKAFADELMKNWKPFLIELTNELNP